MIRVICYALFLGCFASALLYDILYIPTPDNRTVFWKLQFLTFINMIIQTLYSGASLIRALIDFAAEKPDKGPHKLHPAAPTYYSYSKLHAFCDFLYTRLTFSTGLFVVIMFWTLFNIDREMVFPEFLDKIVPNWVNHVMHTAPVPFVLVDSLLICHKYPDRWTGIRSVIIFVVLYEISLVGWYLADGQWAYPLLDAFNIWERLAFFVGCWVIFIAMYLAGDYFNCLIWGRAAHPPSVDRSDGQKSTVPKRQKLRQD